MPHSIWSRISYSCRALRFVQIVLSFGLSVGFLPSDWRAMKERLGVRDSRNEAPARRALARSYRIGPQSAPGPHSVPACRVLWTGVRWKVSRYLILSIEYHPLLVGTRESGTR